MRATLWFIALFGLAVALALFAGNNQGTVTLFWPPWRLDVSLNLVLLVLLGAFIFLHAVLRSLSALLSLPREARLWRQRQRERAMHAALLESIANLMAGRYLRARKLALEALEREQSFATEGEADAAPPQGGRVRALGHLLAAESAHALQDMAMRDEQLQLALRASGAQGPELGESVRMRAARWLLDDRDPEAALTALAEMPQGAARRTIALRMKLKASRLARQPQAALETARLLAKHRAFSAAAAQSILRGLAMDLLSAAHDPVQLQQSFALLEPREREMPEVAVHAARRLIDLRGDVAQAREWLTPAWNQYATLGDSVRNRLVRTLEAGMGSLDAAWLARIEQAQMSNPRDAAVQYLAGMACKERQLWGKARQLLTQASTGLGDVSLQRSAWRALAELAEQRGDEAAAAQAWRKAALI